VRRPDEPVNEALSAYYQKVRAVLRHRAVRTGRWQLLECTPAWEGNWTADCFIAWCWQAPDGGRLIVAVNYAANQSQCYVRAPFGDLAGNDVSLVDLMGSARFTRDGNDLNTRGLYLDTPPWTHHVFDVTPR
jgi:hypothetical protein